MLWFPSGNGRNSQALKFGQKLDAEGEERLGGGAEGERKPRTGGAEVPVRARRRLGWGGNYLHAH